MNSFFHIQCLYLILLILGVGCSTQEKEVFEDEDDNKVIQTVFDTSDERVGEFRIGEIKDQSDDKVKKETPKKSRENDPPRETQDKKGEQKKPLDAAKSKESSSKKSDEDKSAELKPKKDETSKEEEDEIYPEEFVDYDKRSQKLWESTTPIYYPGEKFVYDIKYLGITAAHIKITAGKIAEMAGKKAFHYKALLKSARFYSAIYKMEDTLETYINAKDQIPIRYSLVQRETGKSVDDLQLFDRDKNKTYFFYKREKEGEVKEEEKEAFIPGYFHDTFSAMFFVRGLPMKMGDIYEFPIMTRAKLWLVKIKVDSIEEVKINGEWVDAYKIEAETRFPEELSKERGNITFWVSTSKRRKLLRFSADVRFGSIYGVLVDYSPGKKRVDPKDL